MFFCSDITCFENQVSGWQATYSIDCIVTDAYSKLLVAWIRAHSNQFKHTGKFFGRIQEYLMEPRVGISIATARTGSPRSWEFRSKDSSFQFWEAECILIAPSLCTSALTTTSSVCFRMLMAAWLSLTMTFCPDPTKTDGSLQKPNSRSPTGRICSSQVPKAGICSDELWEVGPYYYLLSRSQKRKIPKKVTCRVSLKRECWRVELKITGKDNDFHPY